MASNYSGPASILRHFAFHIILFYFILCLFLFRSPLEVVRYVCVCVWLCVFMKGAFVLLVCVVSLPLLVVVHEFIFIRNQRLPFLLPLLSLSLSSLLRRWPRKNALQINKYTLVSTTVSVCKCVCVCVFVFLCGCSKN